MSTLAVSFDINKAVDTIRRGEIVSKLYEWGVRGKSLKFINSFPSNRIFRFRNRICFSEMFNQETGSTPLLFIATDPVSPGVKYSINIDDLLSPDDLVDPLRRYRTNAE